MLSSLPDNSIAFHVSDANPCQKHFRCWKHQDVLPHQCKQSCTTKLCHGREMAILCHWLKDCLEPQTPEPTLSWSHVKSGTLAKCEVTFMCMLRHVPPLNDFSCAGQHHVIREGNALNKLNRGQLIHGNMVAFCFSICWPFICHDAQSYCIALWILRVACFVGAPSLHFFSSVCAETTGHHPCIFQVCMQK